VIVFRPLTRDDLTKIVEYEVNKLGKRLQPQGYTLQLDTVAKEFLIEKGYNPEYGARPLRRSIGQYVEDPLSEMLLANTFETPCILTCTRRKGADDKLEDHLFFDSIALPKPEVIPDSRQPRVLRPATTEAKPDGGATATTST